MDKLKKIFILDKKVLVFLICFSIVGIIFGSILPVFLNSDDKNLLSQYLSDFILQVSNGKNVLFLLKNSIFTNCGFAFLIWIIGISVIGVPVVLFLHFLKCFMLGFSVSAIIVNYGFKGILFSLFYIFPHLVINIFVYGLIASYSILFSIKLICFIFHKNEFNISNSFNRYFKIFSICFIVLVISSLYEAFISPIVLKFIFDFLVI